MVHGKHLKQYGIKLPRDNTGKQIQLAVLYDAYKQDPERLINKNRISRTVVECLPHLSGDQQVRHLRSDGWNIENSRGWHRFINPSQPSSQFVRQAVKRSSLLTAKGFDDIKKAWHWRCASCGSREGQKDWRYDDIVRLQKGHKDPEKPEAIENIIPQCQNCNRAYKSDFTFDDKGRVRAVADIGPVRRASKSVKQTIRNFLI